MAVCTVCIHCRQRRGRRRQGQLADQQCSLAHDSPRRPSQSSRRLLGPQVAFDRVELYGLRGLSHYLAIDVGKPGMGESWKICLRQQSPLFSFSLSLNLDHHIDLHGHCRPVGCRTGFCLCRECFDLVSNLPHLTI